MLHDLYGFSQKTCLSTEKKHLTAKKRHLSIAFAANIISVSYTHLTLPTKRIV